MPIPGVPLCVSPQVPTMSVSDARLPEGACEHMYDISPSAHEFPHEKCHPTDFETDPDILAGYQDCFKEALRFLLEVEALPLDHPMVLGLLTHLTQQRAHDALAQLTLALADETMESDYESSDLEEEFDVPKNFTTDGKSTVIESDLETEKKVKDCQGPDLKQQLVRLAYQGCDLIASTKTEKDVSEKSSTVQDLSFSCKST